jgi:hypothetical protein
MGGQADTEVDPEAVAVLRTAAVAGRRGAVRGGQAPAIVRAARRS